MRRRVISTLMALCMALALLPVQVLAADYTVGEDTGISVQAGGGVYIPPAANEVNAGSIGGYVANGLGDGVYTLTEDVAIDGTLRVTGAATLDLNGRVLRMTAGGSVLTVEDGGHLTITDSDRSTEHTFKSDDDGLWALDDKGDKSVNGGVITGGTGTKWLPTVDNLYGGGVFVNGGGHLTMNGGSIVGCSANGASGAGGGGGVYLLGIFKPTIRETSFTMNGGSIIGCTTGGGDGGGVGGGVRAVNATFTMNGGGVKGCTVKTGTSGGIAQGGGVSISNDSIFTMTAGEIRDCRSIGGGGGVHIEGGSSFGMQGGIITGCATGGGVYNSGSRGTFTISGGAVVDNWVNNAGTMNADGGTINGSVTNSSRNGCIITGSDPDNSTEFRGEVANTRDHQDTKRIIEKGTFLGEVRNNDIINGGTFYGEVRNDGGTVSGGTFRGGVINYGGTITGGTFYGGIMDAGGTVSGCTVTYQADGYPYAQQIVQSGAPAAVPDNPSGSGRAFGGWYTSEECEERYDFTKPVTGDMTLYADLTDEHYDIRITDKNGGEIYVTKRNCTDVLGDGTVVYTPGHINRAALPEGYWSDSDGFLTGEAQRKLKNGEDIPGVCLPKLTLRGAALRSIWASPNNWNNKINMYLQLELVGENTISDPEAGGEGIGLSGIITFLVISGDGSLKVTADYAIRALSGTYYQRGGDVTLEAGRMGISCNDSYPYYVLQFHGGRLTIRVTGTGSSNDRGVLPFDGYDNLQLMDGVTFRAGNSAEDSILITPPSGIFSSGNITGQLAGKLTTSKPYYLSLTANYTVTFDTDGGSAADAQTVAYGEKAKAPAAPVRPGYVFGDWYLGEAAYDFAAAVTKNLTLTARWTVCDHKGSTLQPTCTDAVKCTVCGGTLPALGHTWGAWTSNGDGTHTRKCGTAGCTGTETKSCGGGTATCVSEAVCAACGQTYGKKDAGNHDLKHVAAKAPGTYVRGNTEYWQCRDCGKYFADANAALEIKAADIIIYPTGGSTGGKSSPATFDAAIGVYGVTAVTSLAGLALLRRKRREEK